MAERFEAFVIRRADGIVRCGLEEMTLADLGPGDVLIRVHYSSINYKDALAATGAAPIVRRFPLVGGIDLAGEVVESCRPDLVPGTLVLACSDGLGETLNGGYAEFARLPGECVVRIPATLDCRSAMGIGTAGLAAALAIQRLEENGQRPERGPLIVTGATGGVGSLAIDMLAGLGYRVAALTGKMAEEPYLKKLGAYEVIDRAALSLGHKPLESALWGGAIDTLGGELLAWLTRTVRPLGNIASVGLAAGAELRTTVMPFILRGVSLLGINAAAMPPEIRAGLWKRLGGDLRPRHLDRIVTAEIRLADLPAHFDAIAGGHAHGRTVVRVLPS
jgi:acrylyl-CoA reductase (NADPH)